MQVTKNKANSQHTRLRQTYAHALTFAHGEVEAKFDRFMKLLRAAGFIEDKPLYVKN